MNEVFKDIFKKYQDHYDWGKNIAYHQRGGLLPESMADRVSISFETWKNIFGKSVSHKHPIFRKLANSAPWQVHELVLLGETLQHLQKLPGCDYILLTAKLRDSKFFQIEGWPFLELSHELLPLGFVPSFLAESAVAKTPDVSVFYLPTGEKLFIEFSKFEQSAPEKKAQDFLYRVSFALTSNGSIPLHAIRQKADILDENFEDLLKIISTLQKEVMQNEGFHVLENETVKIALAHYKSKMQFDEWLAKNPDCRECEIASKPYSANEVGRLLSSKKMDIKARQIPAGSPGIIAVPVQHYFFQNFNPELVAERLQEKMLGHTNLVGTMCWYTSMGSTEVNASVKGRDFLFVEKTMTEITKRQFFFVQNPGFRLPVSEKMFEAFLSGFR